MDLLKYNLISLKYKGCKTSAAVFIKSVIQIFLLLFLLEPGFPLLLILKYYYSRNFTESEKHEIAISKPCGDDNSNKRCVIF